MEKKQISFLKNILLTSFLTLLLAELFFGGIYYIILSFTQFIQVFLANFFAYGFEANSGIFSPITIFVFVIGFVLLSIITFLEISTIIAITMYDYFRDDHIPLKSLLLFGFERLKNIFNWKIIPIFILILLFPKEHIGASGLYNLEIPPFIMDAILANPLHLCLLFAFGLGILYFVYRSIFLIHILILGNSQNIFEAFKKSFILTKKIGFWQFIKINIISLYFAFLAIFVVFLGIFAIETLIGFFTTFLGKFGIFLLTILNYLENFLNFAIPGVIFFSFLTFKYIEIENFSEKDFLQTFHFLGKNPENVKRGKNIRFLLQKFGKKKLIFFSGMMIGFLALLSTFFIKIEEFHLQNVSLLAHRGYLHTEKGKNILIENTMKAVENAYKNGSNIIEIDVFENKDGNLYLSHDPNFSRVAGINREIAEMSDAEIDAIVLPDGSHIPRLEEVLEFGKKHNVTILIEPKVHGKEKFLYQKVADLIKFYDMYELAMVHSLSLQTILEIDKIDPKIEVGYTIFGGIGNLSLIPVDFYSIQETALSANIVENIHKNGKKVYIWTLNETGNLEKYLFMGIDGIITDELQDIDFALSELKKEYAKEPRFYLEIFGKKILIPRFLNI